MAKHDIADSERTFPRTSYTIVAFACDWVGLCVAGCGGCCGVRTPLRLFRSHLPEMGALSFADKAFLAWWAIHVPITLFVDLQGLLAPHYPAAIRGLGLWWEQISGDPFMAAGARGEMPWFRSFLLAEGVVQLPLFFLFIRSILRRGFCLGRPFSRPLLIRVTTAARWIDILGLLYTGHVCTTVYTIYYELFTSPSLWEPLSPLQRTMLLGAYTPYFFVPVFWAWRCADRLLKKESGGKRD